jgi:hypothetical protein
MLHREKVTVCSEINTKNINAVRENSEFLNVRPVGTSSNQQDLNGLNIKRK